MYIIETNIEKSEKVLETVKYRSSGSAVQHNFVNVHLQFCNCRNIMYSIIRITNTVNTQFGCC